ncbi:hypothetical protein [Enemella sp. A6]|uniref:hypothetical protein n=1 Tax=Enemella sp. A6 TaxID=3440152 RepID=UPI003EBD563A
MTSDQFMLLLCIAIAFVGVLWALFSWRLRSGYGRILQGVAIILAAVGLYLSGLLPLLWSGVKAVVEWIRSVVPDTMIWTGVSFLGAALLAWLIGVVLNSRNVGRATAEQRAEAKAARRAAKESAKSGEGRPAVTPGRAPAGAAPANRAPANKAAGDDLDDMAEIEAILKGRGIE